MEWVVGIITGLISGIVSSVLVYIWTKKKENKEKYYNYWITYLFNVMKECKVWFPIEELLYIDKVGKKNSEWYKAINNILDLTRPYELEDRVFNEHETEISKNVLIAMNELGKWYGIKKR